jgi:hypothetical protein
MAVEQQVFGFQIAVDDVVLVKVVERERNLCSIEFGNRIGKALSNVSLAPSA